MSTMQNYEDTEKLEMVLPNKPKKAGGIGRINLPDIFNKNLSTLGSAARKASVAT